MDKKPPYPRTHNIATRQANTETVFNAIANGHVTIFAIEEITGLSQVTIQRLLRDLEDWPGGARIKRTKNGTSHRLYFEIVTP